MEEAGPSALDLLRRLPPDEQEEALDGLTVLCPQLDNDSFKSQIEKPLALAFDEEKSQYFVTSDYNRHGKSYRSPWSNTYLPNLTFGSPFYPSPHLRELEIRYNAIFDAYRNAYHQGGVSSVYLWALPSEDGFAAAFLTKCVHDGHGFHQKAGWSTAHIVTVTQSTSHVVYRVVSTAWVTLGHEPSGDEKLKLEGQLFRSVEQSHKLAELPGDDGLPHLPTIGEMIEEIDSTLRKAIERVQLNKLREIVDGIRSFEDSIPEQESDQLSQHQPGTHHRMGSGGSPMVPSLDFLKDLKTTLRQRR